MSNPRRKELTSMDSSWRFLGSWTSCFRLYSYFSICPSQGARWDLYAGSIAESKLKELHPAMPVMFIKAVTQDASVSFSSSPHLRRVSRNCKTSMIARCTRLENEAPPTFGLLVSRPRASHPNGFLLGLDSFYKFRGTNCITKNV